MNPESPHSSPTRVRFRRSYCAARCRALVCCLSLALLPALARGDFQSDTSDALPALQAVMPSAEALVADGRVDEANAMILAVFPEKTRTTAQAFILANVLFSQDPKTSYELHKRVAAEAPAEASAQLEWAIEQHRAGEYAAAAASYALYSKAHPDFAPAYGLAAECLLRVGKVADAVDAWQAFESANSGTLARFESLVCDVNSHRYGDRERAGYLQKAAAGSIEDAQRLIRLDCAFPRDWWNSDPNINYLTKDLAVLRQWKFADNARFRALLCAGDCVVAVAAKQDVAPILKSAGFLLDDKATLPQSGMILSTMLQTAFTTSTIKKADARNQWEKQILDAAVAQKDADFFNIAANLNLGSPTLADIDRLAWQTTGDARFAASLLTNKQAQETLTLTDPDLLAAVKQFPDNAVITGLALRLAAAGKQPIQPQLITAILAEYHHFSPQGLDFRPSAQALHVYFGVLAREIGK